MRPIRTLQDMSEFVSQKDTEKAEKQIPNMLCHLFEKLSFQQQEPKPRDAFIDSITSLTKLDSIPSQMALLSVLL